MDATHLHLSDLNVNMNLVNSYADDVSSTALHHPLIFNIMDPPPDGPTSYHAGDMPVTIQPLSSLSTNASKRQVCTAVLRTLRDLVREHSVESSTTAFGILKYCAEACSGCNLLLSAIIQEKSVEGHTPLYWAAIKRATDGGADYNGGSVIPELLSVLLSFASPVTPQTISDVYEACILTSDHVLFQQLHLRPEFGLLSGVDEILLGGTVSPDEISVEELRRDDEAFIVNIEIPYFQKRMLISKRVVVEFIARGLTHSFFLCIICST